jgi:hypothetical protein
MEWTIPKCTLKVILYSASTKTIAANNVKVDAMTKKTFDGNGSSSSSIYITGHVWAGVYVTKSADDIVLAIEFEYPKYDITLSGTATGLQYSLDDGLTFQNVTDGLALEQIEHVVFKNTGTASVNIGTTEGGTDVATIASGKTYVAVPEAGGTWYIEIQYSSSSSSN